MRRARQCYDITFENVQAGERTSQLFRLANLHGGLVVGTGDLSELALGWCTYGVGDHMSHYNVNASVPKTLIKHLVRWVAESEAALLGDAQVLLDILGTEISPELVPGDAAGQPGQSTEDQLGPYELQDFYLYYILRFGFAPSKVAYPGACRLARRGRSAPGPKARMCNARPTPWRRSSGICVPSCGASSRPASSSDRACRMRRRSARAARCRRAATGAHPATREATVWLDELERVPGA